MVVQSGNILFIEQISLMLLEKHAPECYGYEIKLN